MHTYSQDARKADKIDEASEATSALDDAAAPDTVAAAAETAAAAVIEAAVVGADQDEAAAPEDDEMIPEDEDSDAELEEPTLTRTNTDIQTEASKLMPGAVPCVSIIIDTEAEGVAQGPIPDVREYVLWEEGAHNGAATQVWCLRSLTALQKEAVRVWACWVLVKIAAQVGSGWGKSKSVCMKSCWCERLYPLLSYKCSECQMPGLNSMSDAQNPEV